MTACIKTGYVTTHDFQSETSGAKSPTASEKARDGAPLPTRREDRKSSPSKLGASHLRFDVDAVPCPQSPADRRHCAYGDPYAQYLDPWVSLERGSGLMRTTHGLARDVSITLVRERAALRSPPSCSPVCSNARNLSEMLSTRVLILVGFFGSRVRIPLPPPFDRSRRCKDPRSAKAPRPAEEPAHSSQMLRAIADMRSSETIDPRSRSGGTDEG